MNISIFRRYSLNNIIKKYILGYDIVINWRDISG